jgi:BirA family biotin operon repressor/biotin-[acetyl-CoA-carboxylase] ligase
MDEARLLASEGAPHGTVVSADFQERGRGRSGGRVWQAEGGKNLFFTILLRYPASSGMAAVPEALTLRAGLAVALAVEDFDPALGRVLIKWPNDIMLSGAHVSGTGDSGARKTAGILTEGGGDCVYIGIGVNLAQTEFPPELRGKATSIHLAHRALAPPPPSADPGALLGLILSRLYRELEGGAENWRARISDRLYLRGRPVRFLAGAAGQGEPLTGTLSGIGESGELLIIPEGEERPRPFFSGELDVYA